MFHARKLLKYLEENKRIGHRNVMHNNSYYDHCMSVVLQIGYATKADRSLLIAACLHDIGKPYAVEYKRNYGYVFPNHVLFAVKNCRDGCPYLLKPRHPERP